MSIITGNTAAMPSGGIERHARAKRIVGTIALGMDANNAVRPAVGVGIVKSNAFLGAPTLGSSFDPLVADELGIRDWLRMCNTDVPANAFNNAWERVWHLDMRYGRKLDGEEDLRLVATRAADGGAGNVIITIDIRILIVIDL